MPRYTYDCTICGQTTERSILLSGSNVKCYGCKAQKARIKARVKKKPKPPRIPRIPRRGKNRMTVTPRICNICHRLEGNKKHSMCSKIESYSYWHNGKLHLTEAGKKRFKNNPNLE